MEEKKEEIILSKKEKFKRWMKSFFFSFIWLGILMLALDLISKQCIVAFKDNIYAAGSEGVVLIPNFLAVNYIVNTNFIFGIQVSSALTNRIIYIVVGSLLSIGLIAYYVLKHKKMSKYVKAVLMIIIAGALGNLIDRIFYNADFLKWPQGGPYVENGVVDWINFYGIWKFNFNWADSCLVVGVIMLIVWLIVTSIIDYRKEKAKEPKVAPTKQLSQDEIKKLEKQKADAEKEMNKNKNNDK